MRCACSFARALVATNSGSTAAVSGWPTNRGGEWWYSAPWGEATASTGPASVSIDSIQSVDGRLTSAQLHELLSSACEEFAGFSVLCTLNKETRLLVEQLESAGLLRWEL